MPTHILSIWHALQTLIECLKDCVAPLCGGGVTFSCILFMDYSLKTTATIGKMSITIDQE